ncbi:hypothetical protein Pelo_1117 [Pelomyxa schiedti]|nr:hypothetical protein Pelo_1117 [Pelomyxa schiedti]
MNGDDQYGCPGSESYRAAIEWDDCRSSGVKNNTKVMGLRANSDVLYFETSTLFPEEFQRGWRMNFEIYTAFEGRPYDSVQCVNSDMGVNSAKHFLTQMFFVAELMILNTLSALWHDQEFVEWMKAGVNCGAWSVMTSAYSQHVMPFVHDDMNE